jgi:hypothetical protein
MIRPSDRLDCLLPSDIRGAQDEPKTGNDKPFLSLHQNRQNKPGLNIMARNQDNSKGNKQTTGVTISRQPARESL